MHIKEETKWDTEEETDTQGTGLSVIYPHISDQASCMEPGEDTGEQTRRDAPDFHGSKDGGGQILRQEMFQLFRLLRKSS